jgi:MFS family permease
MLDGLGDATPSVETDTLRRVGRRILPFVFLLYVLNYLDRANIGMASLRMNADLGLSASAYGLAAGIFFLGYSLFEVPSNLFLVHFGARRWIARIMVTWGLCASAMMLVHSAGHLYLLRLLLGVAEAGFVPGIVYYLGQWFPASHRARASAVFFVAIPVGAALGGPLGGLLLGLDGKLGLAGWQWLFVVEGLPSVLVGFLVLRVLSDRPADAEWLPAAGRAWLEQRLAADEPELHRVPALVTLRDRRVWSLVVPYFLYLTAAYANAFYGPLWVRGVLGSSDLVTGAITGGVALVAIGAAVATATRADRTGALRAHAALGALLIAIGYLGFAFLPWPVAQVAALALTPIGSQVLLPPFWSLARETLGASAAAVGIALINSVANVGGFASTYLVGWLRDLTGSYTAPLCVLAALALGSALTIGAAGSSRTRSS